MVEPRSDLELQDGDGLNRGDGKVNDLRHRLVS
jgi:hypothetical protein